MGVWVHVWLCAVEKGRELRVHWENENKQKTKLKATEERQKERVQEGRKATSLWRSLRKTRRMELGEQVVG